MRRISQIVKDMKKHRIFVKSCGIGSTGWPSVCDGDGLNWEEKKGGVCKLGDWTQEI